MGAEWVRNGCKVRELNFNNAYPKYAATPFSCLNTYNVAVLTLESSMVA